METRETRSYMDTRPTATQNQYRSQFQGYRGNSKVVPRNKIFLSYLQCFNVRLVHSLVRALFPTNSIPEVPQAGRIKLLFKLVQTYTRSQYPKYCSRVRNFFSQKSCAGKIAQPSSFESGTIQAG